MHAYSLIEHIAYVVAADENSIYKKFVGTFHPIFPNNCTAHFLGFSENCSSHRIRNHFVLFVLLLDLSLFHALQIDYAYFVWFCFTFLTVIHAICVFPTASTKDLIFA